MNGFEKNCLQNYYNLSTKDYINSMVDNRVVDFPQIIPLDYNHIPFKVYYELSNLIFNELKNKPNSKKFYQVIFLDSYLYNYYQPDANIKNIIENNSIPKLIEIFSNDILLGAALIKQYIGFLLLITEDQAYKDILLDDAKVENDKTINKLVEKDNYKIDSYMSLNQILRNILLDLYNELLSIGTPKDEVFKYYDIFFEENQLPDSIKEKYAQFVGDNKNMGLIKKELLANIYSSVFLCIAYNDLKDYDTLVDFLKNIIQSQCYDLPEDEHLRWELYSIFILYSEEHHYANDIKKLDLGCRKQLKKIHPHYFLSLLDD